MVKPEIGNHQEAHLSLWNLEYEWEYNKIRRSH